MYKEKQKRVKSANTYNAKYYDRITVVLPKGERDRLKAVAAAKGMSLNEFIKDAIRHMEEQEISQ